ncbi:unnamed protein product (macronuclear) [Paramecium tetraurelia]|uniref:Nop domain-containing protein n=1 Tax=Paramecium tetraurelia TaxID=5888 RepID=A0DG60_PARTE|nr:uncharacterized protein GSPATT00002155001 [Paramecium tetraurelia]CAK82027.1 unnamed protein product [Paramecium tetraurelia]|eukprot:XP_001449424.1 hypothetical protein (macronuclear) [Paramecium tetraurelia strain d4-2]
MIDKDFMQDLEDEEEQQIVEAKQQVEEEPTCSLLKDNKFLQHYQRVQEVSAYQIQDETIDASHEEYHLILRSNEYSTIIDQEILNIHKQLKDVYHKKFPELEKIIINPIEYVKIVQLIRNAVDLQAIDFSKLLSGQQVVAVNIAAKQSLVSQLSEEDISLVDQLCHKIETLDSYNQKIICYIESRMKYIAPNVSALIGTQLASKLMAAAGGIEKLANMPAGNIQVMGSVKKNMLGMSRAMHNRNTGYFGTLEIVQKASGKLQNQIVRMLATNVAKAARVDNMKTCPKGNVGEDLRIKMMKRYQKIQEPPPAKLEKPLPIPDENKKRRRGGKRFRKQKERLAMTEVRKYANRLKFGLEAEDEIKDTGIGLGMLSQGIGKVKLHIKKDKPIGLSKKLQQRLAQAKTQSGGGTGGLTSSIAFTPTQGIELINPEAGYLSKVPDQYFNRESGFRTVLKKEREFGRQH